MVVGNATRKARPWLLAACASFVMTNAALADPDGADAPPPPPALKLNVLETLDLWTNTQGGLRTGGTALSKFRVSATWNAGAIGDPGLTTHVQIFATNGRPFSGDFVGDVQTLSNIEAPTSLRLFDLWAEQAFGDQGSVRVGLLDLNHDFDIGGAPNSPGALFVASSDAIAPELSKSGRNGPSIFPVSSAGVRAQWTPVKQLTLRVAAFDGVSGDPAHPGAFVKVRLRGSDGALLIGQADWSFADQAQASVGAWSYTAGAPRIDPAAPGEDRQWGVYGFVDGPIGKSLAGWARAGYANPSADVISNFVGGGLVWTGPFPSRKSDQAGVAIERAGLSRVAQHALDLPDAETAIEATYLFAVSDALLLQPDVQYIVHPASEPRLGDALVFGLRIILTGQWPKGSVDTED